MKGHPWVEGGEFKYQTFDLITIEGWKGELVGATATLL